MNFNDLRREDRISTTVPRSNLMMFPNYFIKLIIIHKEILHSCCSVEVGLSKLFFFLAVIMIATGISGADLGQPFLGEKGTD